MPVAEPIAFMSFACAALGAVSIAAAAALRGWYGWLEVKRLELNRKPSSPQGSASPNARVELAELHERVRRLEAIAAGVEF